jgi:hypothetical protein
MKQVLTTVGRSRALDLTEKMLTHMDVTDENKTLEVLPLSDHTIVLMRPFDTECGDDPQGSGDPQDPEYIKAAIERFLRTGLKPKNMP